MIKILVVDVEATCWDKSDSFYYNDPSHQSEIIEIGITELDGDKKILGSESIIVKPEFSKISPFCTELTTLTESFVEQNGRSFYEALDYLDRKYKPKKSIFASWGEYDKNIFRKNCEAKKTGYPFGNLHLNVKALHAVRFGYTGNVKDMVENHGIIFEGTHHRGIDDSRMIARLLQRCLNG